MSYSRRQISEFEKLAVRKQQEQQDGSLRCFITGNVIGPADAIEYDHILPFSKDGITDIENIRIVLKEFNRRKKDQSLYDVRDNINLEKLFIDKKNNIKLQDILALKKVDRRSVHCSFGQDQITLEDGATVKKFPVFYDAILKVPYFYGRIPIAWLENDDQEGLQPRVIDFKRLVTIRDHLKQHPQLAPSVGRLLNGKLKLFDGQHKLAAQVLNNAHDADVKIYISPESHSDTKRLFDDLMITNLEAHSKLKQVPFYTSTLLDRISVIHGEYLEEFKTTKPLHMHSESNFINFLVVEKGKSRSEAKDLLRSAIKTAAYIGSALDCYIAEASKDAAYPVTIDLLNKTLFPATLYLEPADAMFASQDDFRTAETANFKAIASIIVDETKITNWTQNRKGSDLNSMQRKARRIWHKGSVLTWAPYLKTVIYFSLHVVTSVERERILYRPEIDEKQKSLIRTCVNRLFSHPMWDEPEGDLDALLVTAKKQDDLFDRKGLTEKFVLHGAN